MEALDYLYIIHGNSEIIVQNRQKKIQLLLLSRLAKRSTWKLTQLIHITTQFDTTFYRETGTKKDNIFECSESL